MAKKTFYIGGKEIKTLLGMKKMCLNGPRAIYADYDDFTQSVNDFSYDTWLQDTAQTGWLTTWQYTDPQGVSQTAYVFNGPSLGTQADQVAFADNTYGSRPFCLAADHDKGVFCTAAHYGLNTLPTTSVTYSNTRTADFTGCTWCNLYDWALDHGYTDEQLMQMPGINDIAITYATYTNFTENDAPYLMSEDTVKKLAWNGNLRGMLAWKVCYSSTFSSYNTLLAPMLMSSNSTWNTLPTNRNVIFNRNQNLKDLVSLLDTINANTYLARTGDSGKPVVIYTPADDLSLSKQVVVSHNTTDRAGPSYVACFDVLKSFCSYNSVMLKEYQG